MFKYTYKDVRALDLASLEVCQRSMMDKIQGVKGVHELASIVMDIRL